MEPFYPSAQNPFFLCCHPWTTWTLLRRPQRRYNHLFCNKWVVICSVHICTHMKLMGSCPLFPLLPSPASNGKDTSMHSWGGTERSQKVLSSCVTEELRSQNSSLFSVQELWKINRSMCFPLYLPFSSPACSSSPNLSFHRQQSNTHKKRSKYSSLCFASAL